MSDTKNNGRRERHLKQKYGIDLKQYEVMLKEQNYRCAICNKHQSHFKRSLHVDHDHKSGKIRGLLCFRCNHLLVGGLNYLNAAALYSYILRFYYDIIMSYNKKDF